MNLISPQDPRQKTLATSVPTDSRSESVARSSWRLAFASSVSPRTCRASAIRAPQMFHRKRQRKRSQLGGRRKYADLPDLMLMLDLNLGGGVMDLVREGQELVTPFVPTNGQ